MSTSAAGSPQLPPIVAALARPEALQPSAASAQHLGQLLSMAIGLLTRIVAVHTSTNRARGGVSVSAPSAPSSFSSAPLPSPPISDDQHHLNALISHPQLLRVVRAHLRTGDPPAALPAIRLLALLLSIPLQQQQYVAGGREKAAKLTQSDLILKRLHTGVLISGGPPPAPPSQQQKGGGNSSSLPPATPNPSPLLGDLWGMLRAQDPLLTPPCVACLHALATGPCWNLASVVFIAGDDDGASSTSTSLSSAAATSSGSASSSSLLFILRKLHATAQHRGSAEAILACIMTASRQGARWAQRNAAVLETSIVGSAWLEREWRTVKRLQ